MKKINISFLVSRVTKEGIHPPPLLLPKPSSSAVSFSPSLLYFPFAAPSLHGELYFAFPQTTGFLACSLNISHRQFDASFAFHLYSPLLCSIPFRHTRPISFFFPHSSTFSEASVFIAYSFHHYGRNYL